MNKSKELGKYQLTWDRLDLAFQLYYWDIISKNKNLGEKIYAEDRGGQGELVIVDGECDEIRFDYKFYQERHVDEGILDDIVSKFIEYASDTYVAFLWPAGNVFEDEVHSMFTRIVYKKK